MLSSVWAFLKLSPGPSGPARLILFARKSGDAGAVCTEPSVQKLSGASPASRSYILYYM